MVGAEVNPAVIKQHRKVNRVAYALNFCWSVNNYAPGLSKVFTSENAFALLVVIALSPFACGYIEVTVCWVKFDVMKMYGSKSTDYKP